VGDVNQSRAEDPQQVVEYLPDIFAVLRREEAAQLPSADYMERQQHVNAKMRAILVDWLVDVHKKYKLKSETLFLAVGLIDAYLARKPTARKFLQLVGVTALLVAAKFEELSPPGINDFVYVTDKAYSKEEVMRMEVSMLTVLGWKVCRPTAVQFLERYESVHGCTEAHCDFMRYLLELTLVEIKMVKYLPSHVAASCALLSNKLLRKKPAWGADAVNHTDLTEHQLKDCVRDICGLLENAESSSLQAVRKKYSQPKYHEVAKFVISPAGGPKGAAEARASSKPPGADAGA